MARIAGGARAGASTFALPAGLALTFLLVVILPESVVGARVVNLTSLGNFLGRWKARVGPVHARTRNALRPIILWRGKPHYSDVFQGYIGDCYLMAALAAIADKRPERIEEAFQDNQLVRLRRSNVAVREPFVVVRLYVGGQPVKVAVDDNIPVSDPDGLPVFAGLGLWAAAWPALIEKAVAKVHGSYRYLEVGDPGAAMLAITQAPVLVFKPPFEDSIWPWSDKPTTVVLRGHAHVVPVISHDRRVGLLDTWEQEDWVRKSVRMEDADLLHAAWLSGGEVVSSFPVDVNKSVYYSLDVPEEVHFFWLSVDAPERHMQKYAGCGAGNISLRMRLAGPGNAAVGKRVGGDVRLDVFVRQADTSAPTGGRRRFVVQLESVVSLESPWIQRLWISLQASARVEMREVASTSANQSGLSEFVAVATELPRAFQQTVSSSQCTQWLHRLELLNNAEELRDGLDDSMFPPVFNGSVCINLRCARLRPKWARIRDIARPRGTMAGVMHHRSAPV